MYVCYSKLFDKLKYINTS